MQNGSIYVVKSEFFLRTGKLFSNKTVPLIMNGEESLDIDSLEDLKEQRKC